MQTSCIKSLTRETITGQGIHTDGADRAILICLHRGQHVEGALNQFHKALDGSMPLCEPKALGLGEAVAFKDNEIYHYVTPGNKSRVKENEQEDATRTIILMHSPADAYMRGLPNESNLLGANPFSVKLRDEAENQVVGRTATVENACDHI